MPRFLFEVVGVHDAFGDGLVGAEGTGLTQHGVDEGGFAVVDVRDDGDIADGLGGGCGAHSGDVLFLEWIGGMGRWEIWPSISGYRTEGTRGCGIGGTKRLAGPTLLAEGASGWQGWGEPEEGEVGLEELPLPGFAGVPGRL